MTPVARLVLFCLLGLTAVWPVWAAPTEKPARAGDEQPISITADQMEADDRTKMVTFSGSVVARQKDMVLTCQVMRVFYQSSPSGTAAPTTASGSDPAQSRRNPAAGALMGEEENEIERIECEGGVKVTQGDKVAVSELAVYNAKARPRTIIMTGEPRIWRNKDYLSGKKIVYFLDEDRSVVEGGGRQRVNAVFYQAGEEKKPATGTPPPGTKPGPKP